MTRVAGHEIDGPTAWRIVVFAAIVCGFVAAYLSTGSVLGSIVLGLLGAIGLAVSLAAVSSVLRALQRAL